MAAPIWTPGEVLSASDVNDWFVPLVAYKTSSTNKSTTTLGADPDLTLSLAASCIYEIRCTVIYAASGGGFKWGWTVPTSATGGYGVANPLGTPFPIGETWGATPVSATDGTTYAIQVSGFIQTSTSSGSLTFKWSSNTPATSLTVGVGSYLLAQRIG